MTQDVRDLIAEARTAAMNADWFRGNGNVLTRLADVLEATLGERDAAVAAIERVTAERDSAMARIAKAWELHEPFTWSFGYGPVQSCKWCADHGVPQEVASWPCPTIAALDGAPEPEDEEEEYQAGCGSWDCRAPECGRA